MKWWILTLFLLGSLHVAAQDDLKFGDTGMTNKSPKYKPKKKKKRHLIQWIKNDSQGLLIGNRCMTDVTNAMGFEYLIQVPGTDVHKSEFERLVHNLGAKIGILFRNGPFWKFKLKKKRKQCREQTGDYVG